MQVSHMPYRSVNGRISLRLALAYIQHRDFLCRWRAGQDQRLVQLAGACLDAAGWMLAALLTFTAPLSIPLLVWTALGALLPPDA
jgi:hypothetical protein